MHRSSTFVPVLFAFVLWTMSGQSAVAQGKTTTKKTASNSAARHLKLPVEFQGGCAAACCKYGPWLATERIVAYTSRKVGSSIAFTIQGGETVTGLNGTLSTTKPGIVVLERAITVKPFKNAKQVTVKLPAHDTIYTVNVGGDAPDTYWWFRGVTYHSTDLAISSVHGATASAPYDVMSIPTQEWWARVRNTTGATGWVLDPRSFSGIGAC